MVKKSLDALKNNLSLTVINYYFDYLSLLAKKDAKTERDRAINSSKKIIVGRFYSAGTATEDELQKIVSRLQNAIVELQEVELNIITITHNLEYITGTNVSITEGSKLEDVASIVQKNPRFDIQALDFGTQSKQSIAKAQKSDYYPNIYTR